MKTIIVATDFSAEADNAMLYAATAVSGKGYKLVLYNLYNTSIHALNARVSADEIDKILLSKKKKLAEVASLVSEVYHTETIPHLASGNFYEELVKCIELYNADMVVMGMAERSLEQDLLGNTTTAVINMLKFPVLSIPLGSEYKGSHHILFACDVVRGVHEKVLERVRSVAADFNASVEVFHVREKLEEIAESGEHNEAFDSKLSEVENTYKKVESSEIIKAIRGNPNSMWR